MTIRTRLCLAFLVIVGLGFFLLVDWLLDDLRPRYHETMEESMVDTAALLTAMVERTLQETAIDVTDLRQAFEAAQRKRFAARIYAVTKTRLAMRVYVTDARGTVVFDSDGGRDEGRDYAQWNDVALALRGEYGARTSPVDPADPRTTALFVALPVRRGADIVGALAVSKPADSVRLFEATAKRKIMVAGAVAALAVVLLGFILSAWITAPIERLRAYAQAVRDGRRVPPPRLGRTEVGQLGAAFEEMRDALEGKQYVEHYIQTLTHEMKSPLSAIRGAAELLQEDMPPEQRRLFLENIRRESGRIQAFIDRLLQLSAVESRKGLADVEPVAPVPLLQDVIDSLQPVLVAKRLTVSVAPAEVPPLRGERFLLRHALATLLQNAVDFSPAGGAIAVAVTRAGERVAIAITDHGPGIPGYALDKVFDRFYSLRRPDTGEKSSGLGLTFAREVALLHGGTVTLANGPGGGACATLTLPLAPPS